jgi:hypothetical protein
MEAPTPVITVLIVTDTPSDGAERLTSLLEKLGRGIRPEGNAFQLPAAVRDVHIVAEGDTWAILRWKPPVDGGAPGYYRVQRRREGMAWQDVVTTVETEQLLSNQPRRVELSYRVVAVNKAGSGAPSAAVTLTFRPQRGRRAPRVNKIYVDLTGRQL